MKMLIHQKNLSFDDLTIPGDYSDYYIFEEEKETISKNDEFWIKNKNIYGEGGYC